MCSMDPYLGSLHTNERNLEGDVMKKNPLRKWQRWFLSKIVIQKMMMGNVFANGRQDCCKKYMNNHLVRHQVSWKLQQWR